MGVTGKWTSHCNSITAGALRKHRGGLYSLQSTCIYIREGAKDSDYLRSFSKWENQSSQRFKTRFQFIRGGNGIRTLISWHLCHHPTHHSMPLLSTNEGAFPALSGQREVGKPQNLYEVACKGRMCSFAWEKRLNKPRSSVCVLLQIYLPWSPKKTPLLLTVTLLLIMPHNFPSPDSGSCWSFPIKCPSFSLPLFWSNRIQHTYYGLPHLFFLLDLGLWAPEGVCLFCCCCSPLYSQEHVMGIQQMSSEWMNELK